MRTPNVLIFMTDQQRGATLQIGHPLRAITPNFDRFRERATVYERSYSPSPHCCPSRTSFFTSVYPSEHGVWNNVDVSNALSRGPRTGTSHWSELFADAGYVLAFSGQWHVSSLAPPSAHGWSELYPAHSAKPRILDPEEQRRAAREREVATLRDAMPSRTGDMRRPGEIQRPGWPEYVLFGVDDAQQFDTEVVSHAQNFVLENANRTTPWLLYVGTHGPHDPYTPPQRFLDLYDMESVTLPASFYDTMADKPALYGRTRRRFDQLTEMEHRQAIHHYLAYCSFEDELFGKLLDTLETTGQSDHTIVVYLSDHGDYAGDHGLWGKGLPSFQGATQIPLAFRLTSDLARGRVSDYPATLLDVGPTLLDLCSIPHSGMSGASLAEDLIAQSSTDARDVFLQSNGNELYGIQRTVISGDWKLVVNLYDDDELYNLKDDPQELINLLHRPPTERRLGVGALDEIPEAVRAVVKDLYERLWRFALDHQDDIVNTYILTALATFGPMSATAAMDDRGDSRTPRENRAHGVLPRTVVGDG